jgi:hypothetical protein
VVAVSLWKSKRILRDSVPHDLITMEELDGRDVSRFKYGVPREVLWFFDQNGLVAPHGPENGDGSVFRLTPNALNIARELGWRPASPSLHLLDRVVLACRRVLGEAA